VEYDYRTAASGEVVAMRPWVASFPILAVVTAFLTGVAGASPAAANGCPPDGILVVPGPPLIVNVTAAQGSAVEWQVEGNVFISSSASAADCAIAEATSNGALASARATAAHESGSRAKADGVDADASAAAYRWSGAESVADGTFVASEAVAMDSSQAEAFASGLVAEASATARWFSRAQAGATGVVVTARASAYFFSWARAIDETVFFSSSSAHAAYFSEAFAEPGVAGAFMGSRVAVSDGAAGFAIFGSSAQASDAGVSCDGIAFAMAANGDSCLSMNPIAMVAWRMFGVPR
jgi:hypothetical protein